MIRISICFLTFFFFSTCSQVWSQSSIVFTCYNLDSITWDLSLPSCTSPVIDSFQVFTRSNQDSDLTLQFSGTDPSARGYQHNNLKTVYGLAVHYYVRCPEQQIIQSDTISLSALREAVELDTIRVLSNGDVELTWKEKPVSGVRYVVNAAIQGSSQVLETNIRGNQYTDDRGLATRDIEYYSISAVLDCGYTIPEPDSFYHTSLLTYDIAPCGGEVTFDFVPYSYWVGGTTGAVLIVLRNGQPIDTMSLSTDQTSFSYNGLANNETYTFYVKEYSSDQQKQVAFSNPITINTDFYEPIRWIVMEGITIDDQNQATILWETNDHSPGFSFVLHQNGSSSEISDSDLIRRDPYNYAFPLSALPSADIEYSISLQDSCGNTIESIPKRALLTQGQLNGGTDLNVEWVDVGDEEWSVDEYIVYQLSNGSSSLLGSLDGSITNFQYSYDENNPIDSVCYYIVARGTIYYSDADTTADFSIQSNTVCLYGETVVQLPNAYRSGQNPYRPIIVPPNNIISYSFRVFDRYGGLVFETNNPNEGWNGQYQGEEGFMSVYAVQVELTTSQGEQIEKSGSLLLFR